MFPQLRGNLNAEFAVSSIWVHSTDCGSIGIGKIVEVPPVRNSHLILKVYAELQKTPQLLKWYDFYTQFHGACLTKYFVLFLKEKGVKGKAPFSPQKQFLRSYSHSFI